MRSSRCDQPLKQSTRNSAPRLNKEGSTLREPGDQKKLKEKKMTTVADQKKDIRRAEKNIDKLEERTPMAATPMIPPAAQAVAASRSTKGAPLFVVADLVLVAKTGGQMDCWF